MLKREKLLDVLKTRFDYYAAQAVYNELVSSLGLGATLDAAAVKSVTAYLAEKLPGTGALIERLEAFAPAEAADVPVSAEAKAEPEAPAAEAAAEEAPADDGKKKKKK